MDKTVLVTGAGQRIGAAIARHLHDAGMNIIIHYHTSKLAALALTDELTNKRNGSAVALYADLIQPDSYAKLIAQSLDFMGKLHVLINNAACFYPTPFNEVSMDDWDKIININLKAALFLSYHASPTLKEHQGSIVNLSDIYAIRPLSNHVVYNISKAGVDMLTRSLAQELGPQIRVNAIAPGAILWPTENPTEEQKVILQNTALKRAGHALDIAKAVYFLIEDAPYISGQILKIDGGRNVYELN